MVFFGKVYWYTGKWKHELNFILCFCLFSFIFSKLYAWRLSLLTCLKEVLWICHAWAVPKLIRWQVLDCVGAFELSSLFLWFSVSFFSVIHQFLMMITDLFEKGIKKNGSKECLLSASMVAVWKTEWFIFFCTASPYTMLWFGLFHHS